MKLTYFLAEACKNTFVLFDCIQSQPSSAFWKLAHQTLLQSQRDDAIILTYERSTQTALFIKMHVLGADGAFGEFCGNGARCAAAYLFSCYPSYQEFYVVTKRGVYPLLDCGKEIYAVHLPKVQFLNKGHGKMVYGEILEPHLLVEGDLSDQELFSLGIALNQNKVDFPSGINVNAWHVINSGTIAVKTYERGVQRLTQSCGTGSSVCASNYLKGEGEVFVQTPGGPLFICIEKEHLELIGPAVVNLNPIEKVI